MKKVLILPSSTGQGDLSVAQLVAHKLTSDFHVTTVCYDQNRHSPLWHEIPGERVLFSEESHPDHSKCYTSQVRCLAAEISDQSPDLVVALNEANLVLAAVLARRRVVQLTHFIDPPATWSGRKVLNNALRFRALSHSLAPNAIARALQTCDETQLLELLQQMYSFSPFPLMRRAFRKFYAVVGSKRAKVTADLIHRYGRLLGANYLGELLCDELIIHSIFSPDLHTLNQINDDRHRIGKPPLLLSRSLPPFSKPKPKPRPATATPKQLLLTFGGINHPVTPGFRRLLRLLNAALLKSDPSKLRLLIAGRVAVTKRDFLLESFAGNPFFENGGIAVMGNLDHSEHLRLIHEADLVMTQPGYSTLCELVAAAKPFVLFYGLASYYEQYSNFVSATKSGLSIAPGQAPWLQVGEFGQFSSGQAPSEEKLAQQLKEVLDQLCGNALTASGSYQLPGTLPYFLDTLILKARMLTDTSPENHNLCFAL